MCVIEKMNVEGLGGECSAEVETRAVMDDVGAASEYAVEAVPGIDFLIFLHNSRIHFYVMKVWVSSLPDCKNRVIEFARVRIVKF